MEKPRAKAKAKGRGKKEEEEAQRSSLALFQLRRRALTCPNLNDILLLCNTTACSERTGEAEGQPEGQEQGAGADPGRPQAGG